MVVCGSYSQVCTLKRMIKASYGTGTTDTLGIEHNSKAPDSKNKLMRSLNDPERAVKDWFAVVAVLLLYNNHTDLIIADLLKI